MKICHLCMYGSYNEGWNYQENIMPKYHVMQGHDVYQILNPYMWDGSTRVISKDREYISPDGMKVFRCIAKKGLIGGIRLNRYPELYERLSRIEPDILFIHDVQFLDISTVVKYLKKHPECTVYVDNHSDFSNSARNFISKYFLHKILWRHMAKKIEPYVKKFYGVLPARVDFLVNMYKLPKEKCELLVMGADDIFVKKAAEINNVKEIRKKYGIKDSDFLIMTGGKIDMFKTQTLLLMRAVKELCIPNVKLIVFGSVVDQLKPEVEKLSDGENVQYIGWIQASESYFMFAAADLVVFPGRHSVFWEQVAGQGIPLVCKYWEGTTHVDLGGNVRFLYQDSLEEIESTIKEIVNNPDLYRKMKSVAEERGIKEFSYADISRRAIQESHIVGKDN